MNKPAIPSYNDTINADGGFNVAVILQLAWLKARDTRNAHICLSHGLSAAKAYGVRLGGVNDYYAQHAANLTAPADLWSWNKFLSRELQLVWSSAKAAQRIHRADYRRAA